MGALIILSIIIALGVFFFVFLFLVALIEKHPLEALVPTQWEQLAEPSAYFRVMNEDARLMGFEYIGAYRVNRKGKIYGEYITLWLSPDHTTMVRISGGKTAGVTARRTVLISYLASNYIVESTDESGTRDLSGLVTRGLLLNAHFGELVQFHQQLLAQCAQPARQIEPSDAFEIHRALSLMRISRLKELGLAQFVDANQTAWRYSIKGALRICTTLLTSMGEAGRQMERSKRKRPGDN